MAGPKLDWNYVTKCTNRTCQLGYQQLTTKEEAEIMDHEFKRTGGYGNRCRVCGCRMKSWVEKVGSH